MMNSLFTDWIYIGGIAFFTFLLLLWSYFRRVNYHVAGQDRAVYKVQLEEVRSEHAQGLISDSDAAALEAEINHRLQKSTPSEKPSPAPTESPLKQRSSLVTVFIICALPLLAIGLYNQLGNPNMRDQPFALRQDVKPAVTHKKADIDQLMKTLIARAQREPKNSQHWLMLARAYMVQKNYPQAVMAYDKAAKLATRRPDVLSALGEATVFRDRGKVSDQAKEIFDRALAAHEADTKSLFYTGLYAAQQKDNRTAIQTWINMLAVSPANAFWIGDVRNRIQQAAKAAGIDLTVMKPTITPRNTNPAESLKQSAPPPKPSANKALPADQLKMIREMVSGLAERLKKEPNNLKGWLMLARSYRVLGETKKAEEAEAKAKSLKSGNP